KRRAPGIRPAWLPPLRSGRPFGLAVRWSRTGLAPAGARRALRSIPNNPNPHHLNRPLDTPERQHLAHFRAQHRAAEGGVEGDQAGGGVGLVVADDAEGARAAVQAHADLGAELDLVAGGDGRELGGDLAGLPVAQ